MGLMHFLVPDPSSLVDDALTKAHMTGMDGIPWPCRVVSTAGGLMVDRPAGDSGSFHIPWRVAGHPRFTLSTASLMERMRPYNLPLELARGTLNRLRNHMAAWQGMGMTIPVEVSAAAGFAQEAFGRAASQQSAPAVCAQAAQHSLSHALDGIDQIAAAYARQALESRQRQTPKLATLFGVRLDHEPIDASPSRAALPAFNAVQASMNWARIEPEEGRYDWRVPDLQVQSCLAQGWRVAAGPIFEPTPGSLPQWFYLWEDDEDRLLDFAGRFVEQVVARYMGNIHLWHCAARTNIAESLPLEEETKLRLMLRTVETARRIDNRTPLVVSFDLPWAEHMIAEQRELSPLHFADALVRADLGVAGIGLEINITDAPNGTLPRDLLAFSQQIDRWSMFGLPLLIYLTIPSSNAADPLALVKADSSASKEPPPTAQFQRDLVEKLVPLLIAKQSVQGLFWNQLSDAQPHDFPNAGLLDSAGRVKPVVEALAAIRRQHLV